MKKITLVATITVIIGIGIYFYYYSTHRSSINSPGTLSTRAKEYLHTDKREYNEDWRNVSFKEKYETDVSKKQVNIDNCFSIYIPFLISLHRPEGSCGHFFMLKEPKGTVVVYDRETEITSLDEETGVNFRRSVSKEYVEAKVTVNGRSFLTFKKKGESYEKTAFLLHTNKLFVITLSAVDSTGMEPNFMTILNSVQFDL